MVAVAIYSQLGKGFRERVHGILGKHKALLARSFNARFLKCCTGSTAQTPIDFPIGRLA